MARQVLRVVSCFREKDDTLFLDFFKEIIESSDFNLFYSLCIVNESLFYVGDFDLRLRVYV